jgi:hypothetical protein
MSAAAAPAADTPLATHTPGVIPLWAICLVDDHAPERIVFQTIGHDFETLMLKVASKATEQQRSESVAGNQTQFDLGKKRHRHLEAAGVALKHCGGFVLDCVFDHITVHVKKYLYTLATHSLQPLCVGGEVKAPFEAPLDAPSMLKVEENKFFTYA